MLEEAAEGKGGLIPRTGMVALCLWGCAGLPGPPGTAGERSLWRKGKCLQLRPLKEAWGRGPSRRAGSSRKGKPRGGEGSGRGHRGGIPVTWGGVFQPNQRIGGPEETPQNR